MCPVFLSVRILTAEECTLVGVILPVEEVLVVKLEEQLAELWLVLQFDLYFLSEACTSTIWSGAASGWLHIWIVSMIVPIICIIR
jgi:hypothetical protein